MTLFSCYYENSFQNFTFSLLYSTFLFVLTRTGMKWFSCPYENSFQKLQFLTFIQYFFICSDENRYEMVQLSL